MPKKTGCYFIDNNESFMHMSICFKLTATINDIAVSILLDTGLQITSMTELTCTVLRLLTDNCKALKLRLGNNSAGLTSNKINTANLCFGSTTFKTTLRLLTSQPYDNILGANCIVASMAAYIPTDITIAFTQGTNTETFQMMPSGLKGTKWAPLVLAASAVGCLPKADTNKSAILRDVALLFDPTPSMINTDFAHQLRLTTDQPAHAIMRRYSPEEARVLRELVKELYEAAFLTSDGHHEFLVMPQGMPNSHATFQRNIDFTLKT
ncbi:hypothetical protein BB561_005279 [Smittium simulii]|uniref:Uncharacterized protein n=1 Tax=Smittium simulii TaxID=133385 RepID=A0A2T9YBA3_9FUNG|nr:hypothetical protein BB561_005279 [Smittium simulii]